MKRGGTPKSPWGGTSQPSGMNGHSPGHARGPSRIRWTRPRSTYIGLRLEGKVTISRSRPGRLPLLVNLASRTKPLIVLVVCAGPRGGPALLVVLVRSGTRRAMPQRIVQSGRMDGSIAMGRAHHPARGNAQHYWVIA